MSPQGVVRRPPWPPWPPWPVGPVGPLGPVGLSGCRHLRSQFFELRWASFSAESWNLKSSGKRARLRLTDCTSTGDSTPWQALVDLVRHRSPCECVFCDMKAWSRRSPAGHQPPDAPAPSRTHNPASNPIKSRCSDSNPAVRAKLPMSMYSRLFTSNCRLCLPFAGLA